MKKQLFTIISFILMSLLIFNSCTQNLNAKNETSETTTDITGNGYFKYNPDYDITYESFEQAGLEYFNAKDEENRAADKKETSNWFAASINAYLTRKLNEKVTSVYNLGYNFLVTDIGGQLLLKAGRSLILSIFGQDSSLAKKLYSDLKDQENTYKKIIALAESQIIMSEKLDKIYKAVVMTNLNNCLNDKRLQYNAIQLADTKTTNLIESLKNSYADIMENGTDAEKATAEEIINKQMAKILKEWGQAYVNGQFHCTNAMLIMTNYMTGYNVAPSQNMTYVDMYDYIASKIYGWEAEGYEMRELSRTLDKAVIIQDVFLAILYYESIGDYDYASQLKSKYDEFVTFCDKKRINFDYDHVICQIDNAKNKFKSELGILTSADLFSAANSYQFYSEHPYMSRIDFNKWEIVNRLRFGIATDDPAWDSFKQPVILSMKYYQTIVNYYDNKLTLREIFQDHAHFDKANLLLKNTGGKDDENGVHSFVYNDANYAAWYAGDYINNDYLYFSVTDMNLQELPSQDSGWSKAYNNKRDFKFFTKMDFKTQKGGLRNKGYNYTNGYSYVVCWPVVD